ncbi:cyclic pyranopterin monophosphate synthase MoaC [Desulfonema magnum]|uniref:Cyclic pyranopterin monophosphate synthase n=1 Tax=Desulfonema magnum TaxID=45655 RepID=A0A975BKM1_9BACT|nr:cyclic pyranopterin monophosphate synthase MoaC [Desulfonema magnum]QTA87454.1 Molybdopterin biosynthesis protein C [Desulfonema magnum]
MPEFTHLDKEGRVRMVDVSDKEPTLRVAIAGGMISMNSATFEKIHNQTVKKGNVLEAARIAGVMAAKKTSELIPMCHPLNITHIQVDFSPDKETNSVRIEATSRIIGQTGVEMEALTAVSVAALTIYDMCKSYDREMTISDIRLIEKSGGKSGRFVRREE